MNFARRLFLIAAVYGVLVLFPMYFMEARIGRDFPPPITHPEHFYGFVGLALVWQAMFFLISRDPLRYRPAMPVAVLEKLAFGVPAVVLYLQGRLAVAGLAPGLIDLLLAALFCAAYRTTAAAAAAARPAARAAG